MKVCSYCDGQISLQARICRFCKAKQGSNALLLYPAVILLAAGAGYFGFKQFETFKNNSVLEASVAAEVSEDSVKENQKAILDQFANEPVREPAGIYIKPDLAKMPAKPDLNKPEKPSQESFLAEKFADPSFCADFKIPINKKATIRLTNGNSFKCTILSVSDSEVTIKTYNGKAKMTFSVDDVVLSQRKYLFKSVHQKIEALKLFENEVLKYDEDLQTYIDAMARWQEECETVNKKNQALLEKASL